MSKDPLETDVNEGLAKMHEASELVSEEEVEALAEKARKEAELTRKQHQNKLEQQGIEPKG
ncbi:hypothetical protein [Klebsiella sp. BIGb0407]|uniref:hypothetical protein n=1 Tax=Klebsiella sp. BIGb0407 TaxID=2940603 RepID=UPI00216967CA|nr:hypothetical protein [Klebsiella sp. BIGb0407]MCS3433169.1 hypothetical protein [Klebsiella sp. BIGb0407]